MKLEKLRAKRAGRRGGRSGRRCLRDSCVLPAFVCGTGRLMPIPCCGSGEDEGNAEGIAEQSIRRSRNHYADQDRRPGYVGSDGRVFGVAWQGPFLPDLSQLLGSFFGQYSDAIRAEKRTYVGHRPIIFNSLAWLCRRRTHAGPLWPCLCSRHVA